MAEVRSWVQNKLVSAPTSPFRLLFLGDSQTNDGSLEKPTLRKDVWGGGKGYSYRLANLLTRDGVQSAHAYTTCAPNESPGSHVWSAAVAGARASTYVPAEVITNVKLIQPHLVTHMIGTNDFLLQTAPAEYRETVRKTLLSVWDASPGSRQLLIICWPVRKDDAKYAWTEYKSALESLAAEFQADERFELFDYSTQWERTGGAGATSWWSLWPDGTHGLPELHREMTERLAEWFGLPSPMAAFGSTRVLRGSQFVSGLMNDNNPTSSLDIHAAPVARIVTLHVDVLAAISGESDIKIQVVDDKLNKSYLLHHVQGCSLRNVAFTRQIEIPPGQNRYFYLSGGSQVNVYGGEPYERYNDFWAEVKYI